MSEDGGDRGRRRKRSSRNDGSHCQHELGNRHSDRITHWRPLLASFGADHYSITFRVQAIFEKLCKRLEKGGVMAASKQNRRENRAGSETMERLISAAEELFSTAGFGGTSLRLLTQRAGTNIAAVSYHFGSMEKLYGAILDRRFLPILERRQSELERLSAQMNDVAPAARIEALLVSWIDPLLDSFFQSDGLGHLLLDLELQANQAINRGEISDWPQPFLDYQQRFGTALAAAAVHLPHDQARWRAEFICACVLPSLRSLNRDHANGWREHEHDLRTAFRSAWLASGMALLARDDNSKSD
jgi:AcrR family transcriptional regulator